MRIFLGGSKGFVLLEDEELSTLSTESVLCVAKLMNGKVVAGTENGRILLWEGNGEARTVAKDIGDSVCGIAAGANGTLLAGSLPAGAWISKDAGGSWGEIQPFTAVDGSVEWTAPWGSPLVSAIAAHPKDRRTFYFGVEVGGAYRTRDSGKKWYDLGIPSPDVHALSVSPVKHDRIYATTGEGSFCSDDEGFNWRKMGPSNPRQYTMGLAAHPVEADRVIISAAAGPPPMWKKGAGAKCEIYLSTDAGRRFRTVAKGMKGAVRRGALVVNPRVPSEAAFGTTDGELHYSNDGGESFYRVATKLGDLKAVAFA